MAHKAVGVNVDLAASRGHILVVVFVIEPAEQKVQCTMSCRSYGESEIDRDRVRLRSVPSSGDSEGIFWEDYCFQ